MAPIHDLYNHEDAAVASDSPTARIHADLPRFILEQDGNGICEGP